MDKGSIVKSWCEFARDDLTAAKYLLGLHPLKLEIICYHPDFYSKIIERQP